VASSRQFLDQSHLAARHQFVDIDQDQHAFTERAQSDEVAGVERKKRPFRILPNRQLRRASQQQAVWKEKLLQLADPAALR
jgi:hypothetical protein